MLSRSADITDDGIIKIYEAYLSLLIRARNPPALEPQVIHTMACHMTKFIR